MSYKYSFIFFNRIISMILYVFFVSGSLRAVEIELEIVRGSQAAHLKDGIVIFQNLQKNREFVERESFYDPRLFKKFQKYRKYQ